MAHINASKWVVACMPRSIQNRFQYACNTLQHTATHCNALHHTATHYHTLPHTTTHYHTLPHTTTHCHTLQHSTKICHTTATHCNTQHYYCNTLQHTATHCNTRMMPIIPLACLSCHVCQYPLHPSPKMSRIQTPYIYMRPMIHMNEWVMSHLKTWPSKFRIEWKHGRWKRTIMRI